MPAGTERITFDIDGDSQSLVDAVRRAAESLRNLSVQITQEQAKAVAGDRAVEASNQGVASSYQQMAATAATAAAEQVAAVRQTEQANRDAASVAEASAAAQEDAAQKVVRAYGEEAVAAQASAAAQEAAAVKARAAQAAAAAPVRPGVPTGGGSTTVVTRGGGTNVVGVRSPRNPGSITNPIVMVMEAARFTGMGGMAAAIGETSAGGGASENRSQVQQSLAGADPLLAAIAQAEGSQASQSATSTQANLQQTTLLQEIRDELAAGAFGSGRGGGGGGNRAAVVPSPGGGDGGGGGHTGGVAAKLLGTDRSGLFGGPGAFSALSLAGLGFEHVLTVGLSLVGSFASALAGLGVLGAGAFGQMAVGMGSDMAVMTTAGKNVKTIAGDYENLQKAIAVYGKQSKQAQVAQNTLNYDISQLPPAARAATIATAKMSNALHDFWQSQTALAQVQANNIFQQVLRLAHDFVPLIAQAALQNLTIINNSIKPLFAWLEGPSGIAIFKNLEDNFRSQLPTSIHAFTQAVEFLLRAISLASNYTGAFTHALDAFFTRLNNTSDFKINQEISKLVDDFRIWEHFVKLLIIDVYDLFRQDLGTGNSIIQTLTGMLQKLHEWELSTQGQADIRNIFSVHKAEILSLLQLLPLLFSPLAHIYLVLAPELVTAITGILTAVGFLLRALESLGPGVTALLGLVLIAAKLGVLTTALRLIGQQFGLVAEKSVASTLVTKATLGQMSEAMGATAVTSQTSTDKIVADYAAQAAAAKASAEQQQMALFSVDESMAARAGQMGLFPLPAAGAGAAAATSEAAVAEGGIIASMKTRLVAGFATVKEGLAAAVTPVLAALGGILAGTIAQSVIPGLKKGFAGTVGGGAIGGGIGFALGGPLGAAIGAGVGSTFGPTVLHLLQSLFSNQTGVKYGQQFASGFASRMKGLIPQTELDHMKQQLAQAATSAVQTQAAHAAGPQIVGGRFAGPPIPAPSDAQVQAAWTRVGVLAAQDWEKGFNAVPYKSEPAFLMEALQQLNNLSPRARMAAAQTMVAYAQQLQDSGKLPKGSVAKIIQGLEAEFPSFASYVKQQGINTAQGWAAAMNLHAAQTSVESALKAVRLNFGLTNISATITAKNLSQNVSTAFGDLKTLIAHSTGQTRDQAIAAYKQLQQHVQQLVSSMTTNVVATIKAGDGLYTSQTRSTLQTIVGLWAKHQVSAKTFQDSLNTIFKAGQAQITQQTQQSTQQQLQIAQQHLAEQLAADKGNVSARQAAWKGYWATIHTIQQNANSTAHQDLTQWAQQILGGMIAGQKTSLSGVDAIAKQLNTLLSSVGASKIPIPTGISVGQGLANIGSAVGHAQGGLVQVGERGAAGRDTIPMTVGGADIMVGAGEQVAVFNRHQQTVANQMLAPVGGLGGLFEKVRTPHYMSTGGYVYPIAPGVPIGRTDQGVDPLAPAGKPFGPIGDAVIHSTSIGGWPGGPYMFWQLTNGPMAGRYVYLAEEIRPTVSPGQHVTAHQAVAISTGPSQEMGWATASGETLARATSGYGEGQVTPAGASFRAFLTGLSHGQIVGGGVGFTSITAPHVQGHGLIAEMVQKSLDKGTSAANAYAMKKFAALAPAGGSFTGSFVSNGPVEARIAADAGRVGINKIGIAGIIGNAAQESGINPASVGSGGGGLFGFTPLGPEQAFAASRHTAWTDVDTQMAFMLNQWFGQDSNAVSAINASGSPGAAAAYFMNTYERPYAPAANLANREAQAQAAYAAGYQRGGFLPLMMAGGGSPGGGPHHHHHSSREPGGENLWDFIHHVSPTFPVRDLGAKVLEWMADSMNFGRPKPHQVGAEMVQDVVERTGDIIHKWVPKMQGRAHQLYRQWSRAGMPGGKPYTKLQGLDQHIVAWLLRAAHANERLIGGPGEDGPLDEHIANMEHAHARGSQINLFKRHRATLSSQLSKVLGKGGSGGMLDSAERHLEHVIGGPALLQLYQQKIQQLSEELALQRMDLRVFDSVIDQITGAGGMGGLTTLPAFAHGGPVLSTGLALVHRGEWVSPDPQGPYGNVQRPVAVSSPSPPVNVYLVGKAASLDEIIDCRVEYGIARRAPGVVSRHLGRRGRALTRAPGTTPLTVTARGR